MDQAPDSSRLKLQGGTTCRGWSPLPPRPRVDNRWTSLTRRTSSSRGTDRGRASTAVDRGAFTVVVVHGNECGVFFVIKESDRDAAC